MLAQVAIQDEGLGYGPEQTTAAAVAQAKTDATAAASDRRLGDGKGTHVLVLAQTDVSALAKNRRIGAGRWQMPG